MFIGQYKYNLDPKGRVVIPNDYRKQMGQTIVCNKGFEKCITIHTVDSFESLVNNAVAMNSIASDIRLYKRFMMSSAFYKDFDSQGRINLEDTLIEHANITKEVVIVGAGDVIEIWAADAWAEVERRREEEFVSIGNNIART